MTRFPRRSVAVTIGFVLTAGGAITAYMLSTVTLGPPDTTRPLSLRDNLTVTLTGGGGVLFPVELESNASLRTQVRTSSPDADSPAFALAVLVPQQANRSGAVLGPWNVIYHRWLSGTGGSDTGKGPASLTVAAGSYDLLLVTARGSLSVGFSGGAARNPRHLQLDPDPGVIAREVVIGSGSFSPSPRPNATLIHNQSLVVENLAIAFRKWSVQVETPALPGFVRWAVTNQLNAPDGAVIARETLNGSSTFIGPYGVGGSSSIESVVLDRGRWEATAIVEIEGRPDQTYEYAFEELIVNYPSTRPHG